MKISRSQAMTPRSTHLVGQISALRGPCVGCAGCRGLCEALIEALTVPDIILRGKTGTQ